MDNLYKNQTILLFKECYALEKIHGSSAHLLYKQDGTLIYFSGGESSARFIALFDDERLKKEFKDLGHPDKDITLYGEVYGGKCQGMSATYGVDLKFGLEFVHYTKIPTDLASLDSARDADSIQAIKNGVGSGKKMEGVVLRPLVEMILNNGSRVICKHKRDEFKETATPRPVVDPAKLQVLTEAKAIADEWVTATRLQHVLDKLPGHDMTKMKQIMDAMKEDVYREAAGEIIQTKEVEKALGSKTAEMYKAHLKAQLAATAI